MSHPARFCPHCESAVSDEQLQSTLEAYIRSLSPDLKTDGEEYARRLACCGPCPHLSGMTCGLCGCFAAARAAKKIMHCPDTRQPRW